MARVLESTEEALAVAACQRVKAFEIEVVDIRCPPMGCEALCCISVGLLTVWLDHFFMDAP